MSPHHRTRRASMVSTARQVPTQKNTRAKERSHLSLQEPDKRARAHPHTHTHHTVCGGVQEWCTAPRCLSLYILEERSRHAHAMGCGWLWAVIFMSEKSEKVPKSRARPARRPAPRVRVTENWPCLNAHAQQCSKNRIRPLSALHPSRQPCACVPPARSYDHAAQCLPGLVQRPRAAPHEPPIGASAASYEACDAGASGCATGRRWRCSMCCNR